MRAHFGGYFFGQVATFVWLTQAMQAGRAFTPESWPQFSLYNLLVANLWPIYWIAYVLDPEKLDELYWKVYATAEGRAGEMFALLNLVTG